MDEIVLYDMKSPKIPKDWNYKKSVTKILSTNAASKPSVIA